MLMRKTAIMRTGPKGEKRPADKKPRRTSSPEIEVSVTMTVPTRWAAPEVRARCPTRHRLWHSRDGVHSRLV